jgi:hypothetical protein
MAHPKKKRGIQLQEKILLATTFLIGGVAGWYLYITAFAPQFDHLVGQTESVYEDLVVIGEQYGTQGASTPSFQVLKDGSFNYVTYNAATGEASHKEGTLPRSLWTSVKTDLSRTKLETLQKPVPDVTCAPTADGVNYSYDVTLNSVVYTLNTCTTDLAHDAAAIATLDKLWTYFGTLQ